MKRFSFILAALIMIFLGVQHKSLAEDKSVGLNIGDIAPDFTLVTKDGKKVSLSSFKGKVVLLDFWASWCGYCRIANPDLVESYKRFKQYGFDIISISLDKSEADWKEAIEEDELIWDTHYCNFKVWENEIVKKYGVNDTGIPCSFLINEKGIIVDKEINALKLNKKLKWLFVDQVFCYPKKATEDLYFSSKVKFAITNLDGAIVMKGKDDHADISSLKKGYYFVQYDGKKESLIKRNPSSKNITFYPKNVTDEITLSEEANYEVYSSRGKLIKKGTGTKIDLSKANLKSGSINYISISGKVDKFIKK